MTIIDNDLQEILTKKLNWSEFNNKTILITGANGMIGGYLTKLFIKLKEEKNISLKLILLVRKNKYYQEKEFVKILEQNVEEEIKVSEKIDYIIHAASPASPFIMKSHPVETFSANVIGSLNCLKLALEKKAKYVFISSREIYGSPIDETVFTEESIGIINHFDARASYSEGKKASETLAISFRDQYDIEILMLRLAHTYGPGLDINDGRVQSDFIKNHLNNESIKIKGDGKSQRTYTYISDAISGILYAILKGKDLVYNIANNKPIITIHDLAKVIANVNNKNLDIEFVNKDVNASYSAVKYGTLSSKKLETLGWKPNVNLKEGFSRTINYFEALKNG